MMNVKMQRWIRLCVLQTTFRKLKEKQLPERKGTNLSSTFCNYTIVKSRLVYMLCSKCAVIE